MNATETFPLYVLSEIFAHVEVELPFEAVGLVWSDGSISPLINQARSQHRFTVSQALLAEALVAVDPAEKTLVAFYHSHPQGLLDLSKEDFESFKAQCRTFPLPWIVVTPNKKARLFRWNGSYNAPSKEDLCLSTN